MKPNNAKAMAGIFIEPPPSQKKMVCVGFSCSFADTSSSNRLIYYIMILFIIASIYSFGVKISLSTQNI